MAPRLLPLERICARAACALTLLIACCAQLLAPRTALAYCRTYSGATADARACDTTGAPLFWRNACRGLWLHPGGLDAAQQEASELVLQQAMAQWSQAACPGGGRASLQVQYLGRKTGDFIGYSNQGNNRNVVVFRDEKWPYADPNQVALTTVSYHPESGEILDADIEVNATLTLHYQGAIEADQFDLHTIFAHEIGHFVGLAHSSDEDATMYPTYLPGSTAQGWLKDDDRAGLCAIYPADGTRDTAQGAIKAASCDAHSVASGVEAGGCHVGSSAEGCAALLLCALGLSWRRRVSCARASAG